MRELIAVGTFIIIVLASSVRGADTTPPCAPRQLQSFSEEYDPFVLRQIWGDDNRHEFGEEPRRVIRNNAFGVGIMMPRWALVDRRNTVPRYALSDDVETFGDKLRSQNIGPAEKKCKADAKPCDGPYRLQPTPGFCTVFVVNDFEVITAKHCVEPNTLAGRPYVVFGFWATQYGNPRTRFAAQFVYEIDATRVRRCAEDCAVVPLKLAAGAKLPAIFTRLPLQADVAKDDGVYVIGHPNGLPLKIADRARVQGDPAPMFFRATLDTFHGNSGSPVFSASSDHVVGILTKGAPDFKLLRAAGLGGSYCWALAEARPNDLGEHVTRVEAVKPLLK